MECHGAYAGAIFFFQYPFQPVGQCQCAFQYRLQFRFGFVLPLGYEQYFVHISPGDDRRVVVVLANHFPQVSFAVISITRRIGHNVYNGNLFPCQHTQLVAHLQQGIVLRIVGDTDKIGPHLFHQQEVSPVHLVCQRGTYGFLVLMATDAAQFIGLSVAEETLISVEPAESGVMIALVQQGFGLTVAQGCFYAVEAGRFRSPQFRFQHRGCLVAESVGFSGF